MGKMSFIDSKVDSRSIPFGSILEETREKTVVENEDTLLSCAISGIYRNDELFTHFRGSSNIGYIKIKKNDLILSAQNLHLGNANVNLRFEHGIISPAYKVYKIIGADPEYIAQWVKMPQANHFFLEATTEGASQCRKNIEWNTLYTQSIQLPSKNVQRKIAKLLSLVDTKIHYEKSNAEKMKDLKSSMLTKMFPKEGKHVPEIRFEGFTGAWQKCKIFDVAKICAGGTPNTNIERYWYPKEIPWLSSGEVHKKHITFTDNKISKDGLRNSSAKIIPKDSVLIALAGQGKTRGTVAISNIPLTTNQSIAAMIFSKQIVPEFVFFNLEGRYSELRKMSSGEGSRGGLNKNIIGDVVIPYTSKDEQKQIADFFDNIDKLITLHQRKYEKLLDTKKALVEKLIGGDN